MFKPPLNLPSSVEPAMFGCRPDAPENPSLFPLMPRSGNSGRPPQAGAAAHACTDEAARTAPVRSATFRPPDATQRFPPCPGTPFGVAIEGVRGESFPPTGHGAAPRPFPSVPCLTPKKSSAPSFPVRPLPHPQKERRPCPCRAFPVLRRGPGSAPSFPGRPLFRQGLFGIRKKRSLGKRAPFTAGRRGQRATMTRAGRSRWSLSL